MKKAKIENFKTKNKRKYNTLDKYEDKCEHVHKDAPENSVCEDCYEELKNE